MLLNGISTLTEINDAVGKLGYRFTAGKMFYCLYKGGKKIGTYGSFRDTLDMANGLLMFPNETPKLVTDYYDILTPYERETLDANKGLAFPDFMDNVGTFLGEARARDLYERN